MKNNKSFFLILLTFSFLLSCKKVDNVVANSQSIDSLVITEETYKIADSLFIGEPLVKDAEFIRNVEQGGDNYRYFEQFGNLLKKHNKKYANYKSNGFIKALKVSDKLTLELKRKKYNPKDKNSDIQIVLFTKINNAIKDSIVFYKYQLDKDFPKEQRFETLTFLDNNLELFKLESYSGLSEFAFQAEKWEKFKINGSNGKIELIKRLNYKDNSNQVNVAEAAVLVNSGSVENDAYPFISNMSWKYDCNTNYYVVFSVVGGQFRFSTNYAINTEIKSIGNNEYEVYYRHPIIRPIPENMMDCGDYSTETPIAKMKYNNGKIEFSWYGFYNSKTQKKLFTKNPFTQKEENSPIILEKCSS
ncbi:MAG: hypothetical protein ABI426_07460 [Flavobacterium sp.]